MDWLKLGCFALAIYGLYRIISFILGPGPTPDPPDDPGQGQGGTEDE